MADLHDSRDPGRTIAAFVLLTALGFAGNWFNLQVAYSVHFVFGSIFTIVAVRLFGLWWGIASTLIASGSTYLIWTHPYAMIIFTAEMLWVGMAFRKGRSNILIIDALYWLLPGPLLVILFYGSIMHLDAQNVLVIILKQALNGVFNALIAAVILTIVPFGRWLGVRATQDTTSYATVLLHVTTAFLMIPMVGVFYLTSYRDIDSRHRLAARTVMDEAQEIDRITERWLDGNFRGVQAAAHLAALYPLAPSDDLQRGLAEIKGMMPDFFSLGLMDEKGITVGFAPARNEKGISTVGVDFSARPFYPLLKNTLKPVVSDIFVGSRATFKPIFTLTWPVIRDGKFAGFGLGAIDTEKLRSLMGDLGHHQTIVCTILDRHGSVVVSTDPSRKPMAAFSEPRGSDRASSVPGVFLRVPAGRKNVTIMDAWKDACYYTRLPLGGGAWTLLVEYPLAPVQQYSYQTTTERLIFTAILFVLALLVSTVLSKRMSRAPAMVAAISRNIPERIENRESIPWPETGITEMSELIYNFRQTAEALGRRIEEVKAANQQLEDRVRERTEDLERLNERSSLAADAAGIGVWDWDTVRNILVWDDWMYKLHGARREDFARACDVRARCTHPDDAARIKKEIRLALTGEIEFDTRFRIVRPDGEIRYMRANGLVIRDSEGNPQRMIGTNYDITEQSRTADALRQAYEKLQASEENFRTFFSTMDDIIVVGTPDGRIVYANPAASRKLGYSGDELSAMTIPDIHVGDRQEEVREVHAAILRGDKDSCSVPLAAKHGALIPVETRLWLGKWDGADCVFRISKDLSTEQEAEQRFESVFRNSPALMVLATFPERELVDANEAFLSGLGYSMAEIAGRTSREMGLFSNPEQEEIVQNRLQAGKRITNFEIQARKKDGGTLDGLLSSEMIASHGKRYVLSLILDITRRKQAERALQEKSEELDRYFSSSLDLLCIADTDGRFVRLNPEWENVLGYPVREIEGRHFLDFVHPDDIGVTLEAMATLDNQEEVKYFENRYRCRDGSYRWIAWRSKPEGGMIYAVAHDVTGHKQMDIHRLVLNNLYRQSLSRSGLSEKARWITDAALETFNADIARIWVVAPGDLCARGCVHAVNENGKGRCVDRSSCLHLIAGSGRYTRIEGTHLRVPMGAYGVGLVANGECTGLLTNDMLHDDRVVNREWAEKLGLVSFAGYRLFSSKETSIGVLTLFSTRKITPEQENLLEDFAGVASQIVNAGMAEEALAESEERFRRITSSAQDAIIMMDDRGTITYWNEAAERIFGYRPDEAMGKYLHALLQPEKYHEAFLKGLPHFREGGEGNAVGRTLELSALRKDGTEFPIEISISAVSVRNRWVAIGILRDITERKLAEADLRAINTALEKQTILATEMAAKAREASAAKSEFLANMSHEIRTPMNGVIGMTGLLLDTGLSGEQRRFAETVRASGESLLGLINDILDFSKIEAGKLDLEILDFDLQSLLEDFSTGMALRAHEKGLELFSVIDPAVPTLLRGDPGRLRQILNNLTGNAVKFTHRGEITIRVTAESEAPDEAVLRFSVRDTGIGIPKEKIGVLFDKFTQVDASTTRKYGGTGLGLAISRQLVELMGGHIDVVSEEDKGSEFRFTLRLTKQPEGTVVEGQVSADLTGVKVLIVDDNATNREIVATRLVSWGMRPMEAGDGGAALDLLHQAWQEKDPFGIAVIDMQMPGMDGRELGRAIKADSRLAAIPLVMLTSLGTRGDARRFEESGFAGYLAKPVRHEELKDVLSLILAHGTAEPGPIVTRHSARDLGGLFVGRHGRILLAEDNITNQQVALGILRKLGLRADAVADGAEAVKALAAIPYDLVLMDVQMPVMDGLEATRQIRDASSPVLNHDIPVIAMTAHAMQGDREKCLQAGMNDYLSKPVSPQALAEQMRKWLPRETGEEETPHAAPALKKTEELSDTEVPVWNREEMLERLMDDEDLARTIVGGFLMDLPHQLLALATLLEAGNRQGAERQAHTIKGAAANIGGERLRATALEIEKSSRAGDIAGALARMEALNGEFERLKQAMEE